jgi:hypothetical protein
MVFNLLSREIRRNQFKTLPLMTLIQLINADQPFMVQAVVLSLTS